MTRPVEVDTALYALYVERNRLNHYIAREQEIINPTKRRSFAYRPDQVADAERRLGEYVTEMTAVITKAAPLEAEYSAGRWNRYYLVNNPGGHVHREMDCSTCYPTTEYLWLVDLADCDEDAMIAEWGEMACTVCFPSAPTNPDYHRPSRRDAEAMAARQAVKDEREAKKALKNLTPEQVFTGRHGWKIETVAACKTTIRDAVEAERYYPNSLAEYRADAERARRVLLERGMTEAELDLIVARKRKALR